jgi:hypothetical protein
MEKKALSGVIFLCFPEEYAYHQTKQKISCRKVEHYFM